MTETVLNVIDGKQAPPAEDTWSVVLDPVTERPLLTAARSGAADAAAAVRSSAEAFRAFRATTPADRALALLRIADAVERRAEEFAALESANTGKPLAPNLAEEVLPAVDHLRFFAGAARLAEGRACGEYLPDHTSAVRREPLGVCAQIIPWNYPLRTAVWKVGAALVAGNTVVLKPAETTPATAVRLAELAAEHLLPGVLNVVCGDRDTGRLLVADPVPAAVSFTGSTAAGREVARQAAAGPKWLHLELGGNSAVLVFDDADPDTAAAGIAAAAYANAGQDCVAAARVLASSRVHDALVDALVARAEATTVGPPAELADYGPLNNADQLARLTGLIDRLPPRARVRAGGHRVGDRGYFFAPTVVTDVEQHDEIVQEEIFGPVVTVQRFDGYDQAVERANGVPQGLACSVWTRDHATALRAAADLDFGCVWINTHTRFAAEMPHGGFKASGYGSDLSAYALDGYTRVKHVMTDLSAH